MKQISLTNQVATNSSPDLPVPAGVQHAVVARYSVSGANRVTFTVANTGDNPITGLQLTSASISRDQGGIHVPLLIDNDFDVATTTLIRGLFGSNSPTSIPAGASFQFTVDYMGAVLESDLSMTSAGGTTATVQAYRA